MDLKARIDALKAEIDELSDILAKDGFMSVGYKGQPVAHPAVAARHAAIALLHKLEAQLPPDEGPSALDAFLEKRA
jgi:hypothetical protein